MPKPPFPRLLGVAAATAALAALPAPADAQLGDLRLYERENRSSLTETPVGINRADCEGNEILTYRYKVTSVLAAWGDALLHIYVGTSCNQRENRPGGTLESCWEYPQDGSIRVGEHELDLNAARLVGVDAEECTEGEGTNKLWVLVIDNDSEETVLATASLDVTYDTDPPAAPTGISAGVGDTRAALAWEVDEDVRSEWDEGFRVLCNPRPGSGGGDAGDGGGGDGGGDGGTGDGGTGGCAGAPFAPGDEPNPAYFCTGVIGDSERSQTVGSLENGTEYQFAVVAYDDFKNPSPVSAVVCQTPQPLDDFWDEYRDAGGGALEGCGCRATGGAGGPWWIGWAGLAAVVVWRGMRRRRREVRP